MQRIVLKLGGSLLHQVDWCPRLLNLINQLGQHQYMLIVGGGDVVEAMRALDSAHGLDEIAMHWRCVRMLEYTTDVALEILQRSNHKITISRISDSEPFLELANCHDHAFELIAIDSTAFYADANLPQFDKHIQAPKPGWRTTTDAIAIYCAALIEADQCVLLKSCDVPAGMNICDAAAAGILDDESLPMYEQYPNVVIRKL